MRAPVRPTRARMDHHTFTAPAALREPVPQRAAILAVLFLLLAAAAPASAYTPTDSMKPTDLTIELGCEFIQLLGSKEGLKQTVDRLHSNNVLVNFYYGNIETEIRSLIDAGVDYILTDDLDLCLEILGEFGVKPVGQ